MYVFLHEGCSHLTSNEVTSQAEVFVCTGSLRNTSTYVVKTLQSLFSRLLRFFLQAEKWNSACFRNINLNNASEVRHFDYFDYCLVLLSFLT